MHFFGNMLKTSQELRKASLRVVGCQGVEVWQNLKTQIVKIKPKNSNCEKTQKLWLWQNSKTQIWQNSKTETETKHNKIWVNKIELQNLNYKIWLTKFDLQNLTYKIWVGSGQTENTRIRVYMYYQFDHFPW